MREAKKNSCIGAVLLTAFIIWTILIQTVDVQAVGQNGTNIGFAAINVRFFQMTGIHMAIYIVTDWLGLVPILICMIFGGIGFVQLIKRRSLFRVDSDLFLLGIYYILVIIGYLVFEMIPINYRPIPIDGYMEASYPSSTTLLVLSVMPTLSYQANRRVKDHIARTAINTFSVLFSLFMVIGRTVAGVHWLTDIIGSVLLSAGLFMVYKGVVLFTDSRMKTRSEESQWNWAKSGRS